MASVCFVCLCISDSRYVVFFSKPRFHRRRSRGRHRRRPVHGSTAAAHSLHTRAQGPEPSDSVRLDRAHGCSLLNALTLCRPPRGRSHKRDHSASDDTVRPHAHTRRRLISARRLPPTDARRAPRRSQPRARPTRNAPPRSGSTLIGSTRTTHSLPPTSRNPSTTFCVTRNAPSCLEKARHFTQPR